MPPVPRTDVPTVIVTSGEPAGIGPDLCLALAARDIPARLAIAVDPDLLAERAAELGLGVALETVTAGGPAPHRKGSLQVLPVRAAVPVTAGRLDPRNAPYVLEMLAAAADGCRDGRYRAMVTAPVQKSTINDAGVPFRGHTEGLAERLGVPRPVMLLVAGKLRVALAENRLDRVVQLQGAAIIAALAPLLAAARISPVGDEMINVGRILRLIPITIFQEGVLNRIVPALVETRHGETGIAHIGIITSIRPEEPGRCHAALTRGLEQMHVPCPEFFRGDGPAE